MATRAATSRSTTTGASTDPAHHLASVTAASARRRRCSRRGATASTAAATSPAPREGSTASTASTTTSRSASIAAAVATRARHSPHGVPAGRLHGGRSWSQPGQRRWRRSAQHAMHTRPSSSALVLAATRPHAAHAVGARRGLTDRG
ncbi:MAG: hypothetical protein M3P85_06370, partial [Actinomycetota bacterium]|nr:hypothetical protein [Actinomycetota bacterium]